MHSETDAEKKRLERWKRAERRDPRLRDASASSSSGARSGDEPRTRTSCRRSCSTRSSVSTATSTTSPRCVDETYLDLDQIVQFLDETRKFEPKHDDKLQKLDPAAQVEGARRRRRCSSSPSSPTRLAISKQQLDKAGIDGVAQVDSATQGQPRRRHPALLAVLQRLSPRPSSGATGRDEIRVLISTDVLSEGLNLQDATRLINYDIHWNPVRLMQRIGRVDRRMNPEVEERLVADHPEVATVARQGRASGTSCRPTS